MGQGPVRTAAVARGRFGRGTRRGRLGRRSYGTHRAPAEPRSPSGGAGPGALSRAARLRILRARARLARSSVRGGARDDDCGRVRADGPPASAVRCIGHAATDATRVEEAPQARSSCRAAADRPRPAPYPNSSQAPTLCGRSTDADRGQCGAPIRAPSCGPASFAGETARRGGCGHCAARTRSRRCARFYRRRVRRAPARRLRAVPRAVSALLAAPRATETTTLLGIIDNATPTACRVSNLLII